ncbi:hypothetical protein ABPG75_006869 [Micractinium tetrahymenae]
MGLHTDVDPGERHPGQVRGCKPQDRAKYRIHATLSSTGFSTTFAGPGVAAKKLKTCRSLPIAPAVAQSKAPTIQEPATAAGAAAGPNACAGSPPGLPAPVLISFEVPHCELAHGDRLRVVGSCPALGGWLVSAAPALEWRQGHRWVGTLALPPGRHAFKLVIVRKDGSAEWEGGADRALRVPKLAGVPAGAPPLLAVTCGRFGGAEGTAMEVDSARLQVGLLPGRPPIPSVALYVSLYVSPSLNGLQLHRGNAAEPGCV